MAANSLKCLLQPINVLFQVFDALLQLLLTGVLNLIHLLTSAVHHLGIGESPRLRRLLF